MLLSVLIVVLVGLIAGGVVNILADDLPHYRLPRRPRFPDDSPRPPLAWLGITAFLLGKRSSPEGAKLSWRYPVAEIGTIIAMLAALLVKQDDPDISSTQRTFWIIYMAIFVLIMVIDIEHRLILFSVIIPSAVIAVLDALVTTTLPNLRDALIGGAVGFAVFFVLYLGGVLYIYVVNQAQGRNITEVAFGYGDVMLATLSGLILGWQPLIFAMFITVFLGALGALMYLVGRRVAGQGYSMFTALPYGPYIVAGTVIMLLFSAEVRMILVNY